MSNEALGKLIKKTAAGLHAQRTKSEIAYGKDMKARTMAWFKEAGIEVEDSVFTTLSVDIPGTRIMIEMKWDEESDSPSIASYCRDCTKQIRFEQLHREPDSQALARLAWMMDDAASHECDTRPEWIQRAEQAIKEQDPTMALAMLQLELMNQAAAPLPSIMPQQDLMTAEQARDELLGLVPIDIEEPQSKVLNWIREAPMTTDMPGFIWMLQEEYDARKKGVERVKEIEQALRMSRTQSYPINPGDE